LATALRSLHRMAWFRVSSRAGLWSSGAFRAFTRNVAPLLRCDCLLVVSHDTTHTHASHWRGPRGAVRVGRRGSIHRYAAPPIGTLRMHPPTKPDRWATPRDATTFGASCVQKGSEWLGDPAHSWRPSSLNHVRRIVFRGHCAARRVSRRLCSVSVGPGTKPRNRFFFL
jgi:hypothetical protein